MKQYLYTLSQKEMDRKEFLKLGGVLILAALGVTSVIRLFTDGIGPVASQKSKQSTTTSGYGR